VARCSVCGTQNIEGSEVCQRCGAAVNASPTMSISSEAVQEAAQGGHAATTLPSHHPFRALGFVPGSMVADRYRVVSLLGRGGMGEVYGADDLKLGQRVALKFLPTEYGKSSSWRDQFYAEVRMARQVSHPNVCRVYDIGESDGRLFLSMEFVDGEDLASLLRRIGRLPDDKAVEVAQQLCAGLAAAHGSGVLHRDLKPANVMIDGKGRARITDFGLAIPASEADRKSGTAGTLGYLAPELLDGGAPSVQSDLYALGLVLYELFTGKKAFDASSLAELHRRQTETTPKPPSSVVKNFDPAVERAILRCLDHDPFQRPRSAQSVAAALPGGDPVSAALAAGETPSPEMVAAAGPRGSLRPAVAWSYFAAAVVLIVGTSMFLAPHATDWGLEPMNKSPEVLADRAQELAQKLGYPELVDRAFWIGSEKDYFDYAEHQLSGKDWKHPTGRQAWPSSVSFWYRQSPQWMMPRSAGGDGPPTVTQWDPPYETSGMVAIKLDMQGKLLFLRAVPPQVETGTARLEPDWNILFAEAGLDKTRFVPAGPKWTPPETFDSRADWEGHLAERPDLPLHVTAAAYHGVPVYFQVIAPWDKPWRTSTASRSSLVPNIATAVSVSLTAGYLVVGGLFARRNLRRGRADAKGGMRFIVALAFVNVSFALMNYRLVPRPEYIGMEFTGLGFPLFFAMLSWIGYMAVEPYARRVWPKLMVSWQRLLGGHFRNPLVGRDVLLGAFSGSAVAAIIVGIKGRLGISQPLIVSSFFGQGLLQSTGFCVRQLSSACYGAFIFLAILSVMTGVLRRRWLGLAATGLLLMSFYWPVNALDLGLTVLYTLVFLLLLTRLSLVSAASFLVVWSTLTVSPPLNLTQWYGGRAMIALLVPLTLLVLGFYVSLGGQSIFGSALKEE
jgi:serine/threonine protein kinase